MRFVLCFTFLGLFQEPGTPSPSPTSSEAERAPGSSALPEALPRAPTESRRSFPFDVRARVPGAEEFTEFPSLTSTPLLPEPPQRQPGPATPASPLGLQDLLEVVDATYPLLLAARAERGIASGELLSAMGGFDLQLDAESRNYVLGYYRRYIQGFQVTQPTPYHGLKFFSGYRLGTGRFPVYYGYDQTKVGGEFAAGLELPLLRNRAIDYRRAALYKARLELRKAEPTIQKSRIDALRSATRAYVDWVASGLRYEVRRELLEVAQARQKALARQAERGLIALNYDVPDNQRVILSRETYLLAERRKFQQSAIDLSLFLRDPYGLPILAAEDRLPRAFPRPELPDVSQLPEHVEVAWRLRPELVSYQLELRKAGVDLDLARNQRLPELNLYLAGSQDVGPQPVDPISNLTPFNLQSSLFLNVPLQRRYARGRVQTVGSEIAQLQRRYQYARDTIRADVQSAMSDLQVSYEVYVRARQNVEVAKAVEEAELKRLEAGTSSILSVNLRETATADAALLVVDAEAEYYRASADFRAALAIDTVRPPGR